MTAAGRHRITVMTRGAWRHVENSPIRRMKDKYNHTDLERRKAVRQADVTPSLWCDVVTRTHTQKPFHKEPRVTEETWAMSELEVKSS